MADDGRKFTQVTILPTKFGACIAVTPNVAAACDLILPIDEGEAAWTGLDELSQAFVRAISLVEVGAVSLMGEFVWVVLDGTTPYGAVARGMQQSLTAAKLVSASSIRYVSQTDDGVALSELVLPSRWQVPDLAGLCRTWPATTLPQGLVAYLAQVKLCAEGSRATLPS
jgi:hypothetical protein